jgi:mannose-6-phosphate isomerase-like protein (cupin superfamily)
MAQEAKEFRHQTPEFEGVKKTWQVCNSDLMKVQVQVVKNGGENNLHTHTGEDAFWYVISGAVKSHKATKRSVNIKRRRLMARGYKYWFESVAKTRNPRVTAKDQNIDNKRVDLSPQKQWMIEQNTFGTRQWLPRLAAGGGNRSLRQPR